MLLYVIALFFLSITSCHAYLDGGACSMLLQLLFGGVAGSLVVLKVYWKKFTSLFKKAP